MTRPRGFNLQNMQITKLTDNGKAGAVAISLTAGAATWLGAPGNAAIKAFAACLRHSKQGRWPAASAVGSSRKKSSV